MISLKYIKSMFFTICTVILCNVIYINIPKLIFMFSEFENWTNSDKLLKVPLTIFFTFFIVSSAIASFIKAIQEMILFLYYALFYNNNYERMEINIDENNTIKESYIKFKNGDTLPIVISKIVTNTPIVPKEEKVEENKNE